MDSRSLPVIAVLLIAFMLSITAWVALDNYHTVEMAKIGYCWQYDSAAWQWRKCK